MDDFDMTTVAARLGKSKSWLQYRLAEDRERAEPRLQFHHYIGRSPRWDESEYQALRAALIEKPKIQTGPLMPPERARVDAPGEATDARPASGSQNEMDFGTCTEDYASADASSASARVQAFPRRPPTARRRKSFAGKRNKRSEANSSGVSVRPFPSRSPSSTI